MIPMLMIREVSGPVSAAPRLPSGRLSRPRNIKRTTSTIAIASLLLASCGGATSAVTAPQPPTPQPVTAVFQTPQQANLTVADIQRIISQGVGEAQAQGRPSGFVVIDRVGNVLAVFVLNGTNLTLRTPPAANGQNADLQNLNLPAPAALAGGISKTLTAAYFSSMGAAFSSRTANDIVQETFPPSATTRGLESGPLFSVQFSTRRVVPPPESRRHASRPARRRR